MLFLRPNVQIKASCKYLRKNDIENSNIMQNEYRQVVYLVCMSVFKPCPIHDINLIVDFS